MVVIRLRDGAPLSLLRWLSLGDISVVVRLSVDFGLMGREDFLVAYPSTNEPAFFSAFLPVFMSLLSRSGDTERSFNSLTFCF